MPLQYDPEYYKALEPLIPILAAAPQPAVHDVAARRTNFEGFFGSMLEKLPDSPDVEETVHQIKAQDGTSLQVHRFVKKGSDSTPGPAILHIHGGGMILGSVALFSKVISAQVSQTGVQMFSVDYRLAPEHKDLTLVEDCYAGLVWLSQNAHQFNVDPKRIAVMGESAGGGLAAGVTLLARDRGLSPPLAKQILIYPMLDDRTLTPRPAVAAFVTWSIDDNITGWTALLGDKAGKDGVSPYAAPARVESVEGLPPTYIDVGELDIFRDEDIKYAARIAEANISIEFHLYPGVPHAFEAFGSGIDTSKRAVANRLKAMSTF